MFSKLIFTFVFSLFSFALLAQVDSNATAKNLSDANGLKQGIWQGLHPNGNVRYSGKFMDDKPVGIFNYYDTYGNLITVIDNSTDSASVTFYHLNKAVMAEGLYYNQERSGKWKFYDSDGAISAQKYFEDGKENGPARIYYKDGRVARDYNNRNGVKHGPLKDFFPEGKPKFQANFIDGNPDGTVQHFHTNGALKIIGFYKFAVQEGTWTYFGADGKVQQYEIYKNGFLKKSYSPEEAKALREAKENQSDSNAVKNPKPPSKVD